MQYKDKRKGLESDSEKIQKKNAEWWNKNPMSYDWKNKVKNSLSAEWFNEIDQREIFGHRLFAHDLKPYDKIIPINDLRGKKVLEIGCGMGLHSEILAKSGADLVSIDISRTSVDTTKKRFQLKKLNGKIIECDAVDLPFEDDYFDFVWSWGVIHHSTETIKIIRNIHRVLKPGGQTRVMVYNLNGMPAYITFITSYIFNFWLGKTYEECLWKNSDGYMARFYSQDMLNDIFTTFFNRCSVKTFGQDSDGVPLPRYLRKFIIKFIRERKLKELSNSRGSMLFVIADK